jgi:tetratricopeptide (TPR) repeat protein
MSSSEELDLALDRWPWPQIPKELSAVVKTDKGIKDIAAQVKEGIAKVEHPEERARLESVALDWLYGLIRGNINRGRAFELGDVLTTGCADCLGYAKLFSTLGSEFGLDIGIVEVIIDNAGRYVPHPINIFKLSNRRGQLIDPWYGSKNINHRRVGIQVKEGDEWKIEDINWDKLKILEDVRGLPQECIDAITYYIWGNRHLEQGIHYSSGEENDKAIECYTKAIKLYPHNARFYFNRAIALENKGEQEKAERDYTKALKDEASQIRVLAKEYEEIIQLIELDKMKISSRDQGMYLLRKGYISGDEVAVEDVAAEYGIPKKDAEQIIQQIEARLSHEDTA